MDLNRAHIWAAKFSNYKEKEAIFEESYEDDGSPISDFARAQGESFYDHDFFFVSGFVNDIREFFENDDVPIKNRNDIQVQWDSKAPQGFKSVVVADDEDFSNPVSCTIGSSEFVYIGAFQFYG